MSAGGSACTVGEGAEPSVPRALRVTWTRTPETRGTADAGLGLVVTSIAVAIGPVVVYSSRCGALRVASASSLHGRPEAAHQDLEEALGGAPVRRSVVGVELGHGERAHTGVGE